MREVELGPPKGGTLSSLRTKKGDERAGTYRRCRETAVGLAPSFLPTHHSLIEPTQQKALTSRGAEVRVTLHWTTSEGRSYRSMVQLEPISLKLLTITNNDELITTMSVTSDS